MNTGTIFLPGGHFEDDDEEFDDEIMQMSRTPRHPSTWIFSNDPNQLPFSEVSVKNLEHSGVISTENAENAMSCAIGQESRIFFDSTNQRPTAQKRFSSPSNLSKFVKRQVKPGGAAFTPKIEPDLQKNALIHSLLIKLNEALETTKIFVEPILKLYMLCNEEHAVRQFVQSNGVAILREIFDLYTSDLHYRQFLKHNEGKIVDFSDSLGNEPKNDETKLISAMLKLLARLSFFQLFRVTAEDVEFQKVLVKIFDLNNGYLHITKLVDSSVFEKEITLSTMKIDSEKNYLFTKRILPTSMIGCPLQVLAFDWSTVSHRSENLRDECPIIFQTGDGAKLGFSFDHMLPLHVESEIKSVFQQKSVKIVNFINGATFWAVDLANQREILKNVSSFLNNSVTSILDIKFYDEKPRLGALVLAPPTFHCVKEATDFNVTAYRALIVSFTRDGFALIFAVDFGFFREVAWNYLRKLPSCLLALDAAAFLCIAQDAVPALDESKFSLLCTAVGNLSHYALLAEKFVKHQSFVASLSAVMKNWNSKLNFSNWVCELLLSLSNNSRVKTVLTENHFVELFIEILVNSIEALESEAVQEFVGNCLKFLTNLCYSNVVARCTVEKLHGAAIPHALVAAYPPGHALHTAALNLLKNSLGKKASSDIWKKTLRNLCSRDEYLARPVDTQQLLADSIKHCCSEYQLECTEEIMQKYVEEIGGEKLEIELFDNSSNEELCSIPSCEKYYVKDAEVLKKIVRKYEEPLWEVFCPEMDMSILTSLSVQAHVCAALNSRTRLTMFYGISTDTAGIATVTGLSLDVMQCDSLRVGADFALSKAFRPILQPHLYDIGFVPIFEKVDDKFKLLKDVYVVEIRVLSIDYRAYQLEESGKLFMKCEKSATPYSCSFMHAMSDIAEEIEQEYRDKVELLSNTLKKFGVR